MQPRSTRFASEANQKLGRRLAGVGLVVTGVVAALLWYYPEWDFLSAWAMLFLPWLLCTSLLTATRARADVTDEAFVVKTSLTSKPRTVAYDASCEIELDEKESADGKKSTWHVRCKKGESLEEIAQMTDGQLPMRNLAEALCKMTGLAMIDASSDPVIRLEAGDLDLPFRERTKKYRQYDFREMGARTFGVDIDSPGQGLTRFSWHYMTGPAIRMVAIATVVLAIVFYVIDVEWGFPSHVYEWVGFSGIFGAGGIAMLCLGFLQTRLVLGPKEMALIHMVGSLRVWKNCVATGEVEDVRVIHRSVAVISDRAILRFRTRRSGQADDANARWLANEIRSYLLGRAPGADLQPATDAPVEAATPTA